MKPIHGMVVDTGGGVFVVLVDRDTKHYPPLGARVKVKVRR